jgi:hypothetical protein
MHQNTPAIQSTLRTLRIVHLVMAASILLYWHAMILVPAQNSEPLNPEWLWGLGALGAVDLVLGQWLRSRELRIAFGTLRTKPDDAPALGHWRRGIILGDCFALSVVLFGFNIYLRGGTGRQVAPFFIVGAAAFLVWWPKQP